MLEKQLLVVEMEGQVIPEVVVTAEVMVWPADAEAAKQEEEPMEWPEVETQMMETVVLTTLEVLVGQHWAKMVAVELNCQVEEKRVAVEKWWWTATIAVHYYWNWKVVAVE